MKMLVLGAGLQGCASAFDLLRDKEVTQVTLADRATDHVAAFLRDLNDPRLRLVTLDVTDQAAVLKLMQGHTAVMSAIPYYFNGAMAALAVQAGCHFADLGGNTEIVIEQRKLDAEARSKGLSIMPDCGLAPGMVNILAAEGIRRLDQTDRVRIFVGGLPQHPVPPLNYQIVYSLEGAIDYYTTPSWILRDSKRTTVDALSELEDVVFPAPVGTLEAFHTAGGVSTMPFAWEGKIREMEYKTLRYPGHVAIMRPIRELGLLDLAPVLVKGVSVVPRDAFIATVTPKLMKPGSPDLVALRVFATGTKNGKPLTTTFDMVDRADEQHGISSMMRTTGYSLSLTGLIQAKGKILRTGVTTPDEGMPFTPYIDGLRARGIEITETTN
jgi:lysine 6-dehydrogenase